jgi:phosphatidate cytidylyltransferase
MAPPADRPSSDRASGLTNLQKRILSAAVLLPLVIAAIYFGHPLFTILIAPFAGAAVWEWVRVAANVKEPGQIAPLPNAPPHLWRSDALAAMAAVALAVLFAGFGGPSPWRAYAFVAAVLALLALQGWSKSRPQLRWNLFGVVYVAVPAVALVLIRNDVEWGRAMLLWTIALVVAADVGGYLVGRTVGGPKLALRISPNKTWSGLGGAVLGAALAGLCTAFILNHTNVLMLTLISAVLGLLEQGGDLVESAFKRHFGVKDTSQIIPGHGGVLDRVDGLLAVAVAVLVINLWAGGSVLAW